MGQSTSDAEGSEPRQCLYEECRVITAGAGSMLPVAFFLAASAIAWFRWSGHPLSVGRKISLGEFVLGSLISGVFLLTAKSATPKANRKRLWLLLIAMLLVQLIFDVLR